ncbi:MAG: hypothetical protein ACRDL2_04460 [Gaiellaceae bacterium]
METPRATIFCAGGTTIDASDSSWLMRVFNNATENGTTSGVVDYLPSTGGYHAEDGQDDYAETDGDTSDEYTAVDVDISAGACPAGAAPQVSNAFLCYSDSQNDPGVWPIGVAQQLLNEGGYWSPYAVAGNVDGGTNIGGYHLVCNLGSGQSASDSSLGGAGETDGPGTKQDVTGAGHYPIAGS